MFVFVFYLARFLGNTEFGKYEFVVSLGYLVGMFFELGGNMILTKHVARKLYSSIYYAVKIRLVSILITLAVFYGVLFAFNFYEHTRIHIVYASLGIAFSSMMNLYFAFFRGAQKMKYEALVLVLQKAIFIIIALILIYSDKSSAKVLLAFMISMIVGFLLIFRYFSLNKNQYLETGSTSGAPGASNGLKFSEYAKDVFTLALVEVFSSIYYRLNQVFIQNFSGFEEVSIYGVAYKVVEAFSNIPSVLLIVLFPVFAKMAVGNLSEFRTQFKKIFQLLLVLGFASCLLCWFLGKYLFLLLGTGYNNSYIVLRYLTFPLFFLFPNFLITQSLIALNKNIIFAKILFSALVLNIIISLLLVPEFGATGSAISIGICEFVIFISGYLYIRKFTSIA